MTALEKMRETFEMCTVMAGVEPDFECIYITKGAADALLDEAEDENAKLREELESVGTAAYLYGRSDLKAENEKLRELMRELLTDPDAWDYDYFKRRMRELGVDA